MNFWINGKRDALWRVLERVDILIINDGEARALGEDSNLVKVAQKVLARGPKHLIIERGEYGVLMFNEKQVFGAPAFPLEDVHIRTRAGDTLLAVLGLSDGHRQWPGRGVQTGDYLRERHGIIYCRSL